jgi:hypothetical protein
MSVPVPKIPINCAMNTIRIASKTPAVISNSENIAASPDGGGGGCPSCDILFIFPSEAYLFCNLIYVFAYRKFSA